MSADTRGIRAKLQGNAEAAEIIGNLCDRWELLSNEMRSALEDQEDSFARAMTRFYRFISEGNFKAELGRARQEGS